MIEHPNSLLVHHCLQAAGKGDRQTLRALWAPDIVWHVRGSSPWQGELKGADRIFEFLAEIGEVGTSGLHTEVDDIMVSEENATLVCHVHAEVGDRSLDAEFFVLANFMGRRIQEITSVPIDPDHVAEFWRIQARFWRSRKNKTPRVVDALGQARPATPTSTST